ncbi:hypothetical protein HA402_015988 [Bradysia odoriphaga]|nr:hypothetical protein HA402_015988 [Bradysia odoriphaga]
MESFCRLCCTFHKIAKLNNLFEEKNCHLSEKLNYFVCSAFNLDVKDILYVCIRCTELLEAAYEFKLICESADARLLAVSQSNNHLVKVEVICNPEIGTALAENCDESLELLKASKDSHLVAEANCKNDYGTESPKFYCDICGLHKTDKIDLINHMTVHRTSEPTLKLSPDNITGQRRRKKQARRFICDICNISFCRKREQEGHMKAVHHQLTINDGKPCDVKRKPWICETCGREYKSKHTLQYHMDGAHVAAVIKKYSCNFCDYKCREARNLVSHRLVHSAEKQYQCSECGNKFRFWSGLTRHIQCVHRGEKRHKCNVCNQSFSSTLRLKEHMFMHSGENPLKCRLCSRTYRYKNSLLKHMRKRHQDAQMHGRMKQKEGVY